MNFLPHSPMDPSFILQSLPHTAVLHGSQGNFSIALGSGISDYSSLQFSKVSSAAHGLLKSKMVKLQDCNSILDLCCSHCVKEEDTPGRVTHGLQRIRAWEWPSTTQYLPQMAGAALQNQSSFPSLLLHKGQGQRLHKHMNFLGFFCGHESFWKADEKLRAPSLKKKMSMYIKYCIQLHQVYLLHPESHAGTTPPPLGYQEPCSKQSPHSSALGPPWHFKRVFNWGLEMSHPIYPSFQSNTSTECHVSHPRG